MAIISNVNAQSVYIPNHSPSIWILDRMEIKSGSLADVSGFNTSTKSYRRADVASWVDSFDVSKAGLSQADYFNLSYIQSDNFDSGNPESGKSLKSYYGLYKHKAAAFESLGKDYSLVINPITGIVIGYDTRKDGLTWINNRGVEVRGTIGKNIGFYTSFSDEIMKPFSWVQDYYNRDTVLPGTGFAKIGNGNSFNYWLASGYISIKAGKNIDIQFGHGGHMLGNGIRSFYMSDFSRNHLSLRVNTHFWKINYTNIWGMIYDYTPFSESVLPKRHYYAVTHLSLNVTKNLNIGCFQAISFQRDSGYSNSGFEAEYLNPIILYKPIENGLNSPDKAILGLDFKFNHSNHFSWYGQFVISEFVLKEVLSGKGWWANKQAFQAGVKYIDMFGISNLDLQVENNFCRPYMYTSFNAKNAWVNYAQNMAHPLGANFNETFVILRYQPLDRVNIKWQNSYVIIGYDTSGSNYGQNISLSYFSRVKEYGNTVGQGVTTKQIMSDITLSWMVKHNLFLDFQLLFKKTSAPVSSFNTQTLWAGMGIRWNFWERRYDF